MKTLHTINTNFAKRFVMSLMLLMTIGVTAVLGDDNAFIDIYRSSNPLIYTTTPTVVETGKPVTYYFTGESQQSSDQGLDWQNGVSLTLKVPNDYSISKVIVVPYASSSIGDIVLVSNVVGSISRESQFVWTASDLVNQSVQEIVLKQSSSNGQKTRIKSISVTYQSSSMHTITWKVDGETYTEGYPSYAVAHGEKVNKLPTSPTSLPCDGKTFIGWAEENDYENYFYDVPSSPVIEESKTFHAVFASVAQAGGNSKTETLNGSDLVYSGNSGYVNFTAQTSSGTWTGKANYNTSNYIQINKNTKNYHIGSPTFAGNVESIKIITTNSTASGRTFYICSSNSTAEPSTGDLGKYTTNASNQSFTIVLTKETKQFYIYSSGAVYISSVVVTYASNSYQDYTISCSSENTITLDPNGGESWTTNEINTWQGPDANGCYTKSVEKNTAVVLPTPTKIGNQFAGWIDDAANPVSSPYTPNSNVTLTAQWTPNQHTLTWDLDGGKVTVAGTNADVNATGTPFGNVAYGTSIQAPQVAKTGYTFNGWSPIFSVGTTMPDNDLTYTAQWTPNTYTVQFNANGGTGTMGSQSFTYDDNPIALSANIFTRTGYNFTGWNTTADGTGTSYADKAEVKNLTAEPNGVVTLFAQWEEKRLTNFRTLCTYEIILDKNGGTTDGSALVTASKTALTAITPPIYAGRQIAGYYAEPECNTLVADVAGNLQPNTPYTNANGGWTAGEVTLYPKWEALEYTVTWKIGDDAFATSTVSAIKPLALPDPAPTDGAIGCCAEKFIGWSTSTTPTKAEVFNDVANAPAITGDQTFHAVFATPVPGAGTSLVTFSEMGYANEEAVASVTLGDGVGNGDATITFAKSTAATYSPTYYTIGEAVRTYAGNTITVDATYASTTLTQIDFAFAKGENANAITASPGTITDGVWKGNAQSVTFTIGGTTGHRRIASIAVTTEVTGDKYTNYITKCDLSVSASIGAGTITYAVGNAIEVKCGQRSPASKAATLTFASAQDLTCPVTIEATTGFLVSTNKNDNSKYASSITVKPVKTGANKGKLPTIYVRAEANFGVSGQMNGTITASGDEITTTQVNVIANVTCTQYTLTVVDHLGNTISTTPYYEGDEVAEVDAPATDDCSKDYTFDGWSETLVKYGSLTYNNVSFPYSMPANDVTLYPVYVCSKDYHRVTEDLGAENWEGQYLIAAGPQWFADGRTSNLSVINMSSEYSDETIPASHGDNKYVSLISTVGGYVLKTQDDNYNYVRDTETSGIHSTSEILTAGSYPLAIKYVDKSDIAIYSQTHPNNLSLRCNLGSNYFRFYKQSNQTKVYLYKKYLYTTPLICGTIEAEDAVVTSTAGQTIKVNVPITLESTLGGKTTITAESDNDHFTVTPLENVATGKHTIAVHYKPADDATTDDTEIANITLTASHGNRATTTFQVTGRHLPENFVIAAKWGDNWYVLPADMNSESITEGLLIEVDNPADPTKAIAAPNTTKYGLKSVYTSNGSQDRYVNNGERLVFVENVDETTPVANQTLYNGGGDAQNSTNTNIQVNAQYKTATSGYYETHPNRYEWIPTTTDLKDYTLTSAHAFANENARTVSLDNHGVFGTLLQDKSYDGKVRLLPVDNFYAPVELQVVEWKEDGVNIMYTGNGTKATIQIGNGTVSSVLLSDAKMDHAVYNLTTSISLTEATNQPLIISIQDDANATIGAIKLTIPAIVYGNKTSTELVANQELAKATDIVILDGATLEAGASKYTYDNITVYPGGSLIIGKGSSLGMYTLNMRAGSSWGAGKYENKYPHFLLVGDYSNTSGQINLDYVTTVDYYYPLSVPEEVTIADIKYPVDIYGSNVDKDNTGSFQLKYYDGAQRVDQGSQYGTGWVVVDETTTRTLTPNQGYAIWGIPKKINGKRQTYGIHRIPIKKAAGDLATNEKTNAEIPIKAHGINDANVLPNDKGWNYLGNPYLAGLGGMDGTDGDLQMGLLVQEVVNGQWTGGWVNNGEQVRYVTLTNDCQTFEAKPVAEAQIPAFTTFFIQAAQDGAIALTAPTNAVPSSIAARQYAAQQEAAKEITTGILLTGNDQTDRTGLLIADNFTEEYEFNADLSKFENSGINLYTIGKTGKLAYMAINQTLAEQPIPVGYTAPAEGLYTIAFDEDRYDATDISALYLIDYDSNEKTNLLHTDYSFVTAAGTNNQRFALQVAFAPENATNIEWVGDATVQVGVEGNTLMLNNLPNDAAVHVFDALGRLMYHAPTVPTEMQLTLPTGYYLVRIADKQNAVVIKTVIP